MNKWLVIVRCIVSEERNIQISIESETKEDAEKNAMSFILKEYNKKNNYTIINADAIEMETNHD